MGRWEIFGGLVAFLVSALASILVVYFAYRFNVYLARRIDLDGQLMAGNRSLGIALGACIFAQACLLRHAVFPIMTVVRDLLIKPVSAPALLWSGFYVLLFLIVVSLVAVGSVALAAWLFHRLTGSIPEAEEILRDNVAVAIFFAFVILAITVVMNEGVEDLSRSIIPYPEHGVIRIE